MWLNSHDPNWLSSSRPLTPPGRIHKDAYRQLFPGISLREYPEFYRHRHGTRCRLDAEQAQAAVRPWHGGFLAPARLPDIQFRPENHLSMGTGRVLDSFQEQFGRRVADFIGGLFNDGECRHDQSGPEGLVKTGKSDFPGNDHTLFPKGIQRARSQQAVAGEDGVGGFGELQEF